MKLMVLASALVSLPAVAHAQDPAPPAPAAVDDDDGYFNLLGLGGVGQSGATGLGINSWYYPRTDAEGINKLYMYADGNLADPGVNFDLGWNVWKGLTFGIDAGFGTTSASGTGAPATGHETIGGPGLSVGWIAVHTPRFVVHPLLLVQRAGHDEKAAGRVGVHVEALGRILKLLTIGSTDLWLTAYASAGYSTVTIDEDETLGTSATYTQTFVSVGVSPIDIKF